MMTVFEKIPEIFIELYDAQFQQWAREFRARGYYQAIVFNRPPGALVLLGADGQPVWKGAWFEAHYDAGDMAGSGQMPKMVIRPRTERDEDMVARHCREMARHVLN